MSLNPKKVWTVSSEVDDKKGMIFAHLEGPKGQYTMLTLSKDQNKITGFDFDYDRDAILNELYHFWDEHFRYNEAPHYVPENFLDNVSDEGTATEDAYNFSAFFESLLEAKDDYIAIKDKVEDLYENVYSRLKCFGEFVINEIEIKTPTLDKLRISTDVCDVKHIFENEDFWQFIDALEKAYYELYKKGGDK